MSHFNKKFTSGFTLMELMVSISISVVILGVVIYNQNKYTSTASLNNAAQAIAADLATAQTFGVSVRQTSSGSFNTAYGLHFRTVGGGNTNAAGDYVFFADMDINGQYNNTAIWGGTSAATCPTPSPGECIRRERLNSGLSFGGLNNTFALCYIPASGGSCVDQTGSTAVTRVQRLDITFSRPETKANIRFYNNAGSTLNPTAKGAGIRIRTGPGDFKWICVYQTGQISVQDAICS